MHCFIHELQSSVRSPQLGSHMKEIIILYLSYCLQPFFQNSMVFTLADEIICLLSTFGLTLSIRTFEHTSQINPEVSNLDLCIFKLSVYLYLCSLPVSHQQRHEIFPMMLWSQKEYTCPAVLASPQLHFYGSVCHGEDGSSFITGGDGLILPLMDTWLSHSVQRCIPQMLVS